MSDPAPHITIVTLGVRDFAQAVAFYEGMGLKRAAFDNDDIVFFDMGGLALALFPWDSLAKDAEVGAEGSGFRGSTLAWNMPDRAAVDGAIARAVGLGATLVKPAHKVFWGGYSGYVADLDGHLWEIVHNPIWPLRANGSMDLPPPAKS